MTQPFTIIIDVQEKTPFLFQDERLIGQKVLTKRAHLTTGDYSIEGFEDKICIERKSLPDLFGSCGGKKGERRRRFKNEFERMSALEYAALVIEADWDTIYKRPPARSRMSPKQILRTINAWHMRYNVHVWPCPGRRFAEKATFLLLNRFYRNKLEEGGL